MMDIRIDKPLCFIEQGHKDNQEDSLFPPVGKASADSTFLMVCDGMGGHENGEVASATVASVMGRELAGKEVVSVEESKQRFNDALSKAYDALDEIDTGDSDRKMGTTLAFWTLATDGVLIAHIGDSRVYHIRHGKGGLRHTKDHSLVEELITAGEMTREEAAHSKVRNVITRAIQPHQERREKATFDVISDVRPGDIFFLCSDGVLEQTSDDMLAEILLGKGSAEERVGRLCDYCKGKNTRDNNSCYLVEIKSVEDNGASVRCAESSDTTRPMPQKDNFIKRVFNLFR